MPLQIVTDAVTMLRRFMRSASIAIGMPSVA